MLLNGSEKSMGKVTKNSMCRGRLLLARAKRKARQNSRLREQDVRDWASIL